jgi:hypothetical protein
MEVFRSRSRADGGRRRAAVRGLKPGVNLTRTTSWSSP